MKKHLKILFATDFSLSAKSALRNLEHFYADYQADVYLMHVIPSTLKDWLTSGEIQQEALQRLLMWQEELQGKINLDNIIIEKGDTASLICHYAEQLDVSLILLGGESMANYLPIINNSVAQYIVKHANQSILLSKVNQHKKILCAIHDSPASQKALYEAADLAKRHKLKLTIASVIPQSDFNPLGLTDSEFNKRQLSTKKKKVKALEKVIQTVDLKGISTKKLFLWGKPSRVILSLARDFDYDIIIIGSSHVHKFRQAMIGSTAESILKHTPCSLLIIQ